MSDVMHGPSIARDGRRKHKTYLIAFLDDATRVITHAAFAFAENTRTFLPVFKQALLRRGIPERLYVDNGANYRSHQFAVICAKLGVALIHARQSPTHVLVHGALRKLAPDDSSLSLGVQHSLSTSTVRLTPSGRKSLGS
jgi:hypothetical protein